MSGRFVQLVIKIIPFSVRYAIVMDEFVRTPRGDYNSAGITAEELLRNMASSRGKDVDD